MKNGPYEMVVAPTDYPGKRYRGRYCYKHHLVWWQHTGEIPGRKEVVHHKNENKMDNAFENLEKTAKSEHTKHHMEKVTKEATVERVCVHCKSVFSILRHEVAKRIEQQELAKGRFDGLYCSRSCQVIEQQSRLRHSRMADLARHPAVNRV